MVFTMHRTSKSDIFCGSEEVSLNGLNGQFNSDVQIRLNDFYKCNSSYCFKALKINTGIWNIWTAFIFLPWCSVGELCYQVQWRVTTILDLVECLCWTWVCMCYQRSLSVIANQCLTCSEMLMFLIVVVVLHALSLWWTSLKVRIDNILWIYSTKSHHHSSNENSRCSPYVGIRLILSIATTSCYTVLATHYTRARVSKTFVYWIFDNA